MNTFEFDGRNILYSFTPAKQADAPLVVILHGHTKTPAASRYQSPDMNVLCPVDNFGFSGWGSWYLGENGDNFWLKAMPALIREVYDGDKLLFCGSSMGGYGAILHGILNRALAVYANIPQTRLLGSSYSESGMKKFFEPVFKPGEASPYNDLRNILAPDLPTSFILSGLRWDKPHYIEEQTLPFIEALCRHGINFQSEIRLGEGHALTYTTAQSIDLLRQNMENFIAHYQQKERIPPAKPEAHPEKQADEDTHARLIERYLPALTDDLSRAARNICEGKSISIHSYRDIPIAENFWDSGDHSNRTWKFSLHSFALFDVLMAAGEWDKTQELIEEWIRRFTPPDPDLLGRFPWHDHATALRLDRLSVMCMAGRGLEYPDLARQHAELLLRDDFYSKHTNHGYDQALSLLLASYAFQPYCDTTAWQETGLERLIDELNFAFNGEGVHVENSPAYHVGMTANLVRARFLLDTLQLQSGFDFETLLNKAMLFTAWITGPDQRLALLGDSTVRGGLPPKELSDLPSYQHVLCSASGGRQGRPPSGKAIAFPDAGYGIYRSSWDAGAQPVHLVMKCGFLSRYHRQDDDLNILLQGYGEHWLIDSGLYNHNQKDPVRIYMRSALAHNIPFLKNRAVSRVPPEIRTSALKLEQREGCEAVFSAETQMYQDTRLSRTVIVESQDCIQIIDTIKHRREDPGTYIQFHVPMDKKVRTSPHMARIIGSRKQLTLRVAAGATEACRLYHGLDKEFKSAFSPEINVCTPSQVIVFGPVEGDRIRFKLQFDDIES